MLPIQHCEWIGYEAIEVWETPSPNLTKDHIVDSSPWSLSQFWFRDNRAQWPSHLRLDASDLINI